MKSYEANEDIPLKREGLVNALVDHELKALSLLVMEEAGWYSPWDLQGRVAHIAHVDRQHLVGHNTFRSYCGDSFAPIGLAVKNLDGAERIEFEITPFGLLEGKALSGHMLELASRLPEGLSLQKIFGMTHSKNKDIRAPINRARILNFVYSLKNAGTSLSEIAQTLDEDYHTTATRLISMTDDGLLIETKREPRGNKYVTANPNMIDGRLGNRTIPASKVVQELVQEVADISPKSEFWTDEVYRYLVENLEFDAGPKTRSAVRKRLEVLTGRGALTLLGTEMTDNRVYYPVEEYRSYIEEAGQIIMGALTPDADFIENGLAKAAQILKDPDIVQCLIRKAVQNSPQARSYWVKSRSPAPT